MTRRIDAPLGAPVWIDLLTNDLAASQAFYCGLLGWTVEPTDPRFGGYTNFLLHGERIAGSIPMGADNPHPDLWSVYLRVDDCEATVEAARAAGGRIDVPAQPVGELGVMAIIGDPGGAVCGAWQPGEHRGFAFTDEPGAPTWFEHYSHDYDTTVEFYQRVFGWTTDVMSDSPEFRYTRLMIDGEPTAAVMGAAGHVPDDVPSHWGVYFLVDDIDASSKRVAELGGTVLHEPHDSPFGRLGAFLDSNGAAFKLMSH